MEWLENLLDFQGVDISTDTSLSTLDGAYEWLYEDLQIKVSQGWPEWLGDAALQEINGLALEAEDAERLYVEWAVLAGPFLKDAVVMMGGQPDTITPSIDEYVGIIEAKARSAAYTAQQESLGNISTILKDTLSASIDDAAELMKPTNWPWYLQAAAAGVFVLVGLKIYEVVKK